MDKTETAQPDSSSQSATPTDMDGTAGPARTSGGPERSTGAGEVLQRYLKAQATQISRIAASLNQYRQDVQQLEVSLIARIGDVDDDRRHAATRLQRTLQTQRDELDERLKRHGSLMAMLLLLFSLLVAGTLIFFLHTLNATQEALETQMHDLRKTLEQLDTSSRTEPDPQTRAQLDRLSAALAGISQSIERLNEETTVAPLDLDLSLQPQPSPLSTPEPPPAAPPTPEPAPGSTSDSATDGPSAPDPLLPPLEPAPATESGSEPAPAAAPLSSQAPEGESTAEPPLITPDVAPTPETTTVPVPQTRAAPPPEESDAVQAPELATHAIKVGDRPFTVQLIGFHSLEALERFAADHVLPVVYYYRQETYQGRPWFTLIHSLHATQESAEAVVARLPPALADLNIWIRRLKPDTELIEVRRLGS